VGGFLKEEESLDDTAERVLYELTGLRDIYLEQIEAFSAVHRDDAGRVISVPYYALINSSKFDEINSTGSSAKWFDLDHIPDLIFDHKDMVYKALERLQYVCSTQPVGFELLPKKFTLPQLMALYEAIFQQEFDKRNFRKKVLSYDVLVKLEEKDMSDSRKGAFLYQFNKPKYDELRKEGMQFTV
jgi:hypothetical protein